MRHFILSVIISLFSLKSFAQSIEQGNKAPKNEIGLHICNYSLAPFKGQGEILSSYAPYKNRKLFQILNGITYKRHFKKYSIRSAFFYSSLKNDQYIHIGEEDKYHEYLLKSGFEIELTKKKFTPYLAADLALAFMTYSLTNPNNISYNPLFIRAYGVGISPALGLKYNFTSRFSINAECSFESYYMSFHLYRQAYIKSNNMETRFNPLQKLSLNLKF